MEDRRSFLTMLAALAAAAPEAQGAPQQEAAAPPRQSRTVGAFPLPPPYEQQTATFVELYIPPGKPSKAHKHPGFVLGYVIEGEFRFQVAGQPERILRSGEIFYEAPGATHTLSESANPDRPARVLAIVIAESGKPITEPA